MPDSGLTGIRSALSLIADSTRLISIPGRSAFRCASDPVQGVLDRQPPHPPGITLILTVDGVGPPSGTVQGRIRQTQTLCNHRLLSLRSGQLRDRVHLIQTTTHQPQTGHGAGADPRASSPPEPAEQPSNDEDQTGPTPTPEDSVPHPPRTVDPDPPPSTIHRSRRERRPDQKTQMRPRPHPPDHS